MAFQRNRVPGAPLSVFDAVVILVGIVVGIGIFRTPSLVAAQVGSEAAFIGVWVLGGLITLAGALCYAELAAAHPSSGGEYHFLSRAYGQPVAILFGWARSAVIQTGAIAGVAFVLGDYAATLVPAGPYGGALYAAAAIVALTLVNVVGVFQGKTLQLVVTLIEVAVVLVIIAFGLFGAAAAPVVAAVAAPGVPEGGALGLALVFVLLTYGGWNEAAYLAGEVGDAPRRIARVFLIGTALLIALYVLVNLALLAVLGLGGLRQSNAVATDMMRAVAGENGAWLVGLGVVVAAISTLNATIFTGALRRRAGARHHRPVAPGRMERGAANTGARADPAGRGGAGAGGLRRRRAGRFPRHGGLRGAGVLGVHAADRPQPLRAALS